ncbi:hypothetical protein V3C99_005247 [Haemonchus contortus]
MDSAPPDPVASDQSDPSALDSNDAMDSSSFALQELDLSEDALLAPTQEPAAAMEAGDGQLAQSMEDLSLLSPAVPASSSSANPALQASFEVHQGYHSLLHPRQLPVAVEG